MIHETQENIADNVGDNVGDVAGMVQTSSNPLLFTVAALIIATISQQILLVIMFYSRSFSDSLDTLLPSLSQCPF